MVFMQQAHAAINARTPSPTHGAPPELGPAASSLAKFGHWAEHRYAPGSILTNLAHEPGHEPGHQPASSSADERLSRAPDESLSQHHPSVPHPSAGRPTQPRRRITRLIIALGLLGAAGAIAAQALHVAAIGWAAFGVAVGANLLSWVWLRLERRARRRP